MPEGFWGALGTKLLSAGAMCLAQLRALEPAAAPAGLKQYESGSSPAARTGFGITLSLLLRAAVGLPVLLALVLGLGSSAGALAQDECWGGAEKSGAFCYPRCKAGYAGEGPMCWGSCPAGYANDGLTCRRDAHIFGANNDKCPWHDKCGLVTAKGCSTCPAGYANDGCTCRRDVHIVSRPSYGRGTGWLVRRDYRGIFERYIRDHRNIWLPSASPLTPSEKAYLSQFFPRRLIDQVRIYDMDGMTGAFNFKAAATTYGSDLIAVRKGYRTEKLLKHEFVHVCQYDRLGSQTFATAYADQFVDGGYNEQNGQFEKQAYAYADLDHASTPRIKAFLGYCE